MVEGRDVQAGAVERPGQTDDDGASIGWKWSIGRADVTHLNGGQGEATSVSEDPQGAPRGIGRRGTVYIRATGSDGEQGGQRRYTRDYRAVR